MRGVRASVTSLGALAAVLVVAASAAAHRFTGERPGEPRIEGVAWQQFYFEPFTITCERAGSVRSGNVMSLPSETLYVSVKYSDCTIPAGSLHKHERKPIAVRFTSPVDLEYHANGFVESGAGSESKSEIKNAGAVELSLRSAKCVISWAPQTTPSQALQNPMEEFDAATFEHEEIEYGPPEFEADKDGVRIHNDLTGMTYSIQGALCGDPEPVVGTTGAYRGILVAELPGSRGLSWE